MGGRKVAEIPPTPDRGPQRSQEEKAFEDAVFAAELGTKPDDIPSVDLHGLDREDAIREVDAFIAHEAAQGSEVVKIIQGRGTGTLRNAVLSHLERLDLVPYVREARQRVHEQGGVIYAVLHDARLKK